MFPVMNSPIEGKKLCGRMARWRLLGWTKVAEKWMARTRERRVLSHFSERELKDIGLSSWDAIKEYEKPFWRP